LLLQDKPVLNDYKQKVGHARLDCAISPQKRLILLKKCLTAIFEPIALICRGAVCALRVRDSPRFDLARLE